MFEFKSTFVCSEMSDNDDEEYDAKFDSPKRDADDPKPLLQERKETEKRTSSPSVKKDKERPRYQVGETLWCYDGPDLYPAKCMKLEHDGKMYSYLIHYNGWSKTYDEWMYDDDPRLATAPRSARSSPTTRSKTPSPIKIESEKPEKVVKPSPLVLSEQATAKPKAEKPAKTAKEKIAKAKSGRQKVKKMAQPKPRRPNAPTDYQKRFVLRIVLPECLKSLLQDDHDFVTKQQKIIPIPARVTGVELFAEFREKHKDTTDFESFFNKILSSKLLYKFERPMFADFLRSYRDELTDAQQYPTNAPKPAEIYGFTHMVRFVYHLDQILFDVDTDFASCHSTVRSLQLLVDFLAEKCPQFHRPENYRETAPAYHRRAQS